MARPDVALVVLALAAYSSPNGTNKVGICYTRNMVVESSVVNETEARRKLRNVVLSAASAKRSGGVALCLFTDLPEDYVRSISEWYDAPRDLFDVVLPDGLANFTPKSGSEKRLTGGKGDALLKERNLKIRSRLGRIANMARGPFEMTLFVDDDTYFCNRPELHVALHELHRRREAFDVRGKIFAKSIAEEHHITEALRCVWRHADAAPFSSSLHLKCLDRRQSRFCNGAQGGAFAVSSGSRASQFASDWRNAYLAYYVEILDKSTEWRNRSSYAARSFGGDQAPLARLMGRACSNHSAWTFGALPSNLNVRDADRPSKCVAPVFGPLLLLHHKRYVSQGSLAQARHRLDVLCDKLNRPHDDGGVVWLGTRPPIAGGAKKLPCSWMRPHKDGKLHGHQHHHHDAPRPPPEHRRQRRRRLGGRRG